MRRFNTVLIFLLSTLSIAQAQTRTDRQLQQAFENNFSTRIKFKGDPVWNIHERMQHHGVPGASIAVIQNGKIAWHKAYGLRNRETGERVTSSTLFQCASISKTVTALGALALVDKKRLDLDRDVNRFLQTWQLPGNEFTTDRKVTLRHLLSHKGGITVSGFRGYAHDEAVPSLLQVLNGSKPANSPPIRVAHRPGERKRYSGGGYCIVQQLMMDVSETSFPELMRETVFDPLGMKNAEYCWRLSPEQTKRMASGYLPDGEMVAGQHFIFPEMAAAGLCTTAQDMAKLIIELQTSYAGKNAKLLSQASVSSMLTHQPKENIGLGVFLLDYPNATYLWHGGRNRGFDSRAVAHLEQGYGVVVLTNTNQTKFVDEVMASVARTYRWEGMCPEYKPLDLSKTEARQFVGRYRLDKDVITISEQNGKLTYEQPGRSPAEYTRVSTNTFAHRSEEILLRFEKSDESSQLEFHHVSLLLNSSLPKQTGKRLPEE